MAKSGELRIDLRGDWPEFQKVLAQFEGNFREASRRGIKKALLYAIREIDTRIRRGDYEKLAEITQLLKSAEGYSSVPLIRTGGLIRAISRQTVSDFRGIIGIRRSAPSANVAEVLHEGTTIRITPAMRRAFVRKYGRQLTRKSTGKTTIRIPPRRFIGDVFDDPAFVRQIEKIFMGELSKVF